MDIRPWLFVYGYIFSRICKTLNAINTFELTIYASEDPLLLPELLFPFSTDWRLVKLVFLLSFSWFVVWEVWIRGWMGAGLSGADGVGLRIGRGPGLRIGEGLLNDTGIGRIGPLRSSEDELSWLFEKDSNLWTGLLFRLC